MSKVDLHIHSTASDGRLSPAEVVRKSVEAGLAVIALADHDTVDGIAPALEAAKAFPQLKVIPGVEISTYTTKGNGRVHMLGYFIDYTYPELQARLRKVHDSRLERARRMAAKLGKLGVPIEWERVEEIAGGGSVGRPHIARALLEKGYIGSITEAFAKYISHGGPAYVERWEKVTPVEAMELILRAGGLPVLAHPAFLGSVETIVAELKTAGLVGIEAYYNGYTTEEIKGLVSLAEKYGLVVSGGSDYHGLDVSAETMIGGVDVPMESVEQLVALAEQRVLKLASP